MPIVPRRPSVQLYAKESALSLSWRRHVVRRIVIVNLKSGRSFRGVLVRQAGPLLMLRNAEMLETGRPPLPVDGEVVIERAEVDFIQAPDTLERR